MHKFTCVYTFCREASLRPQADWVWRSDQASVQEEGQDHKEDCAENGVRIVQKEEAGASEEVQAL